MATARDTGTLGGNSRLPLPERFGGTMEKLEDWSWHVRSYVSMFKEHVLRVMDTVVQAIEENSVFSRQLHCLLSLLTKNNARLVVRGDLGLNGFETWRLLSRRFALPSTANNISLLTKVLEFRFRSEHFEQDHAEWEQLKNRYERQTGAVLPDSMLVATLLNKTAQDVRITATKPQAEREDAGYVRHCKECDTGLLPIASCCEKRHFNTNGHRCHVDER